jgi:undecaprenol kinase
MNSALSAKIQKVTKSFIYAFQGLLSAVKVETNLKIHLFMTVIVLLVSVWLSLSTIEWLFILFAIGGVIAFELLNTAIERVVDLVTEEYHPLAKQAKDIAAGAVLVYAFLSVVIGLFIFLPKLLKLLN